MRVPWTTRYNLLPHLDDVMDPEFRFSKRSVKFIKMDCGSDHIAQPKFIKMALNSDNILVRTITNVGLNGTLSIMGGNWRHLRSKYGMKE